MVVACGILALAWFPWCAGACPLLRARALLTFGFDAEAQKNNGQKRSEQKWPTMKPAFPPILSATACDAHGGTGCVRPALEVPAGGAYGEREVHACAVAAAVATASRKRTRSIALQH